MFAMSSTTEYSAMEAGQQCISGAQRTQNSCAHMSAQTMCSMWACASAIASIFLLQTGVIASVSLFVLLVILDILLVTLVSLLSLSCLTGLFVCRVGRMQGLFVQGTSKGE